MDEELNKVMFLADFFCSELAVEVFKYSTKNGLKSDSDHAKAVSSFGEALWRELAIARDEGDTDSGTEWA